MPDASNQDEALDGEILDTPAQPVAKHPAPWSKGSANTLTAKQSKFIDAILADMLPSEAYRHAYDTSKMNPKTISIRAHELLHKHSNIKAVIAAAKAKKAEVNQYNKSYVLERLAYNAEVAAGHRTQKIKRVVNGEVVEVEAHFLDRASSNRALELVGKEAGMFVDRREVGTPGEFARLDDAQLNASIAELLAALKTAD